MPQLLSPKSVPDTELNMAQNAVETAILLDSAEAIAAASDSWHSAAAIGIDTEFVRERTFHPRPGLIQLSDGHSIWLLDAVNCRHSTPLGALLGDQKNTKILHSVGEDLEVLHAVGGSWPEPLFDTQVAAAMLGLPLQIRYEHLVEKLLGVELVGGKARNDWCRRPLSPALLAYAAEDVIWLPRLKSLLEEDLDKAGRLAWHRQDCARIVTRAVAGDDVPALARVKGAGRLSDPALAHAEMLAEWREQTARNRDLPRRFVIDDETLMTLAQSAADNSPDQALAQLHGGQRKRYGDELSDLMSRAPSASFKRPDWIDPLGSQQREQVRLAQSIVRSVADELGVEPAVIASKKELTRLVRGEHPDWLNGWRGEVLAGRLEPASVTISPPPTPAAQH